MQTALRKQLIQVARGLMPAERLLKNAAVLNIFTGEILHGNVAIDSGYIVGVGDYTEAVLVEDVEGRYLVPGFINAHCHVESSMVLPGIYCAEELRWGTTTLITDPHEVANVAGSEGILFMLEAARKQPVNYYVQLPSCVPATSFEHTGAILNAEAISTLLEQPGILGIGEMMNYPGLLHGDAEVMKKLALAQGRVVDGHAPGLSGADLQAYVLAGIHTDHESTSYAEALEKLRAGLAVLVREGSACRNLDDIIRGVVADGLNTDRLAFCTDDKHIAAIRREGTIRHCVRKSIALGLSVADAYRIASYNAAQIYGLKNLGAISPGWQADLLVLDDLEQVSIHRVYKNGRPVIADQLLREVKKTVKTGRNSVHIGPLSENSFALKNREDKLYPVIGVVEKQIATNKSFIKEAEVAVGLESGRLCKIAVIERHHATGNMGVGLLAGYGLHHGAIASTVGHDSHNLIVVGSSDADMLIAVQEIQRIGGGYVLVHNGVVEGTVPLPIFGLMSDDDVESFIKVLEELIQKAHLAGVAEGVDPFITLSFLALPVIPALRITDMGVFDVEEFRFI